MEGDLADQEAKRLRYELLPQQGGRRGRKDGSSSFGDAGSEVVEAERFEAGVVKSYAKLLSCVEEGGGEGQEVVAPSPPEGSAGPTFVAAVSVPTVAELNKRYRRLVKIGEGSFGEVFVVFDTHAQTYLTMKWMLKLLHKGTSRSLIGIHNTTFRELQLLSTLRHPNVVDIVDYHILGDGSLIMFMPIVAHDFGALMRHWGRFVHPESGTALTTRMPLPVIKCFFRQLLEGVAFLHRKKIVHRDLKPSNIMVDTDGILKIIDFGWARYMSATASGKMTGPPCVVPYRPPEVLIGGSAALRYTFAVDVWCCGCILFEMLSGGTVFVNTRRESEALEHIVDWLGSPSPGSKVYSSKRGRATSLQAGRVNTFQSRCATAGIAQRDSQFLARLLVLEPSERATAAALICDGWFTAEPAACTPREIPLPPSNTYRYLDHQRRRKRM